MAIGGRFAMSNALALRQAARDGCGPALLADWLIDHDIAAGALVDLFAAHRATATSFKTAAWLLWASRDYFPRKTRAVMQFFEQALEKPTVRLAREHQKGLTPDGFDTDLNEERSNLGK